MSVRLALEIRFVDGVLCNPFYLAGSRRHRSVYMMFSFWGNKFQQYCDNLLPTTPSSDFVFCAMASALSVVCAFFFFLLLPTRFYSRVKSSVVSEKWLVDEICSDQDAMGRYGHGVSAFQSTSVNQLVSHRKGTAWHSFLPIFRR